MKESQGRLYSILPDGRALIAAPMPDEVQDEVRILWHDRDGITPEQRRKIFAINGEIAAWSGNDETVTRTVLQNNFLAKYMTDFQMATISLSSSGNCDKGLASLLIDFLINFCMENNVPTKQPLQELADDPARYTYAALIHKRCLVCNEKAELHHVDAIGMGYNRREKSQIGAEVLPLCWKHHREYHDIGKTAFLERYHAEPVRMDQQIAGKYGIRGKAAT